jgi:DNA topoisomerase I
MFLHGETLTTYERKDPSSVQISTDETIAQFVQEAGLRYVRDDEPGFLRVKRGKGFVYRDASGKHLDDEKTLARIKSLAIPPAWTKVWICRFANGHLQATGRDAKGRKQYRYHADWTSKRNETKFDKLTIFAKVLPLIRAQVEHDLKLSGMPREKVLAAVIRVMEITRIRVGNDHYA